MIKQLALTLCAGLLLSLPACCCKNKCTKAECTETSVDAQATCSESACTSCETKSENEAPAPSIDSGLAKF